jgi:hypothetical protein
MENESLTAHPGGFLEDDTIGIDRAERMRIARELGKELLKRHNPPLDVNGKDAILLAFVPSTRFSRAR